MMQFEITALRMIPSPTPIRNELQIVFRMQFVIVTYSQGRFFLRQPGLPRSVMQSSPLSMMQSLTVTKRQLSMSSPSPFLVYGWL